MRISLVFTACTLALSRAFAPINCPSQYPQHKGSNVLNRIYCDEDIMNTPFMLLNTRSAVLTMNKNDENDGIEEQKNITPQAKNVRSFFDAMLEIPDTRLFAGDILVLLIVNFLLQIADEIGDPSFWLQGGFSQPVTMPTTLLALVIRDSKMTIAWILGGLWNRAYSTSSVSDDETAIKDALRIWVTFFSLRIISELGGSFLVTHSPVDAWPLAREVWYTAIVMSFFRLAYGRFLSNFF